MQHKIVKYQDSDLTCHGYMVYDENQSTPQPTILLVHAFDGITDHIKEYADKVAQAGYTVFAADMFGKGRTGKNLDECMGFIKPLFGDRAALKNRIFAAFNAAKEQSEIDEKKIAAMGFCFGGMSVLDLARAGADVKGVASLHGLFVAPEVLPEATMTAKVLILHGYDDPQVQPDQLPMIAKELNDKNVDWQFVYFSHTKHAYTEPRAAEIGPPEFGREYNKVSAERAWQYCQDFFKEVLS